MSALALGGLRFLGGGHNLPNLIAHWRMGGELRKIATESGDTCLCIRALEVRSQGLQALIDIRGKLLMVSLAEFSDPLHVGGVG